jgi:hypothetical protein
VGEEFFSGASSRIGAGGICYYRARERVDVT